MFELIDYLHANGYHMSRTLWGVAFAVDHPLTGGSTVRGMAKHLGCSHESIYKHFRNFKNQLNQS